MDALEYSLIASPYDFDVTVAATDSTSNVSPIDRSLAARTALKDRCKIWRSTRSVVAMQLQSID